MKDREIDTADLVGAYPYCRHCGSRNILRDAWAGWNFATGEWVLEQTFDACMCGDCENETLPEWAMDQEFRTQRVRRLNDAMRRGEMQYGSVVLTAGVQALGQESLQALAAKVAAYDDFTEDNDPHQEHDFGSLEFEGEKVFWKIDYFDRKLKMHSPDKADPNLTHRVLTIMLASEY